MPSAQCHGRPHQKCKTKVKIAILTYQHNEHGNVVSYHGSKTAAEKALEQDKKVAEEESYDLSNSDITVREVPATKKGFLEFLNRFTPGRDNG